MNATWVDSVNSAVAGLAAQIISLVQTNLPVIIGVLAAFISIQLAKKLIRSLVG